MLSPELDLAYTHWLFDSDTAWDLEQKGFKWQYVGPRGLGQPDLGAGEYVIVTDDFPLGDVVATKKLLSPRVARAHGLEAVSPATQRAAAAQRILGYFAERDSPIEVLNMREKYVAVIHPATRAEVAWQGSMFDKDGPFSHKEGDTQAEVLAQLVEDGFTVPEEGAMDRLLDPTKFYELP
jgi:hypothetical protein